MGVEYLVTQKIFWSYNEGRTVPYHYFYWEGMDGTKISSFLPTSYTYRTDPTELMNVWRTEARREIWMHSSCPLVTAMAAAARQETIWNMRSVRLTWKAARR